MYYDASFISGVILWRVKLEIALFAQRGPIAVLFYQSSFRAHFEYRFFTQNDEIHTWAGLHTVFPDGGRYIQQGNQIPWILDANWRPTSVIRKTDIFSPDQWNLVPDHKLETPDHFLIWFLTIIFCPDIITKFILKFPIKFFGWLR